MIYVVLSAQSFALTVSLRTTDGDSVFYAELADTVTIDVSLDSEGEVITGFELFLAYNPSLFLPIDTDPSLNGNQPATSAGVFGQVFADSVIVADAATSVIHYAEVDLIGQSVSGNLVSIQFRLVGRVSGTSPIRVLQDLPAGFSSLYTTSDRDGESIPIPESIGVVFQDLPPVLSDLTTFEIEEDGGPAVPLSDLASDESGTATLTFSFVLDDSSAGAVVDGDSLRFVTPANFTGELTGRLIVRDPAGGEDSAEITLTVTPVNDAPEITASAFQDTITVGDEPVVLMLVGEDIDNDLTSLLWFALISSDSLSVDVTGTNLTLTAIPGWDGSASLTLQLADPGGLVDTLPITVLGAAIKGDFDRSGSVDFFDFLLFAAAFGRTDAEPRFDLDGSGVVDFPDFLIFVENFG